MHCIGLKGKAKDKAVFSSLPCLLPADTYDVLAGSFLMRLALLKVSKSQKHFFVNSIAQKTNEILDKILPYLHLTSKGNEVSRINVFEIY